MKFIRPNTKVTLDDGNIKGFVSRVVISANGIEMYEVVFYGEGVRYCEWCEPDEVVEAEVD